MIIEVVNKTKTTAIRTSVMDGKMMRILPFSEWKKFSWNEVRMLLHETGTYVVPTLELIRFLESEIADSRCIEIGAGNGWIGRALGIPITDSCQQEGMFEKMYYDLMQQPTIQYPKDIIRADALTAIRRLKPQTVIGCYVTHKWIPELQSGNYKGVDFERLWSADYVRKLILVGNTVTHRDNPLLKLRHKEVYFPGLLTRSPRADENRVFIWEKD